MTPFHVEPPEPDEEDDEERPEPTVLDKVRWARDQAAARVLCMIEGHLTDPDEVDDYGQAPCLRCDRWVYVD